MPYRDLKRDARAIAEPEDVCLVDLQVPKESRDVVGRRFERNGRIAVGGAPVALLLNGDDPPAAGEDWEHSAEGDLNGRSAAVKQDKRHTAPATMQLVVD